MRILTGILVLATWVQISRAAPFSGTIRFRQPDGTEVRIWGEGDEFHADFETPDGYTVVFDPALRAYCYAALSADRQALTSTGRPVHLAKGQELGLTPHLRIDRSAVLKQAQAKRTEWERVMPATLRRLSGSRRPELQGMSPRSTLGTQVDLCLLIDFEDDLATIPPSEIAAFCNGTNYTGYANHGSVREYFADGHWTLEGGFDVATGVRLPAVLIAPGEATVITPLTTLLQHLQRESPGTPMTELQALLKQRLGLVATANLLHYDPLAGAAASDASAGPLLSASAQVIDTIVQVSALFTGAGSAGPNVPDSVALALASQLRSEDSGDLAEELTVKRVIRRVSTELQRELTPELISAGASLISRGNRLKGEVVERGLEGLAAAREIGRIQAFVQTGVAEDLARAGANPHLLDDVLFKSTDAYLVDRVKNTPLGDVLGEDTRAGTFAFDRPDYLILENDLAAVPVRIRRTEGNRGRVGLRVTLSERTGVGDHLRVVAPGLPTRQRRGWDLPNELRAGSCEGTWGRGWASTCFPDLPEYLPSPQPHRASPCVPVPCPDSIGSPLIFRLVPGGRIELPTKGL